MAALVTFGSTALKMGVSALAVHANYLIQTPDMPDFAAGMTAVPKEIALAAQRDDNQQAGFAGDMAGMMAFRMNAEMMGWDRQATQSGFFDDPATWGGAGVPAAGDVVNIPSGINIWARYDIPALKLLWNDGFLGVHPYASVTFNIDSYMGSRSSRFWIGDEDNPYTKRFRWIFPRGPLDLTFDPRLQSRCFMTMGRTRIHGKPKAAFMLTDGVDLLAGATSVNLAGIPAGWEIGDTISIPATWLRESANWGGGPDDPGNDTETRVISMIAGTTVHWTTPLEFDHDMNPESSVSDIHIGNLTRNISFESPPAALVIERGHVMPMFSSDQDFRYVEFAHLGRTDKREFAWDYGDHPDLPTNGGAGITIYSNIKGRYSGPHFHGCGPDDANIKVVGCSVHSGFSLGFVSHSSNVDFLYNVAANLWGSGLFTESGNEAGYVEGFVGMGHKTTLQDVSNKSHVFEERHDWGHSQMFWMQSRVPECRNINVYGCSIGAGVIWNTRGAKQAKVRPQTLERRDIRGLNFNAEYFFDSDGEHYQSQGLFLTAPTLLVEDVRVVACLMTGQVEKSGSQQDHYDYSQIRNVKLINVGRGWHFEYTGRYIYDENECVLQSGFEGFVGDFENAVRIAIEAYQFTIRHARSVGNIYGIKYDHVVLVPNGDYDRRIVPDEEIQNFVIGPIAGSARVGGALLHPAFATGVNEFKDTYLEEGDLDLNPAYPILDFSAHDLEVPETQTEYNAILGTLQRRATVTDSLGVRELPAGRDRCLLTKPQIWGGLRINGFWTETGTGRCFFEMFEHIRDAATGVKKTYTRRVYLAAGSFSGDPRGAPSPWVTGGWVNNGSKP